MKITEETIKHVAELSRLEFKEDEIGGFTAQMSDIIKMAEQLSAVDTTGVPETVQIVDRDTTFREDKPEHWQDRDTMLKNVPEKANGYIKVPVIINKDDND
ncbi:MAG: Asp-tRNA(Asn)/Glu-tRNA(Gln) amidotransferase subunit GatC [Lactobacillus sp.]|nr:Asp-tRNA(Asn)/Glu-tRNA(Gln) amidotransferase subunit GatC [Lactobacillus sp.]